MRPDKLTQSDAKNKGINGKTVVPQYFSSTNSVNGAASAAKNRKEPQRTAKPGENTMSVFYRICPKTQATCSDKECLKDQIPNVCPKEQQTHLTAPAADTAKATLSPTLKHYYAITSLRSIDGCYCELCGGKIFIDASGVSHHGTPTKTSHEEDLDHPATPEP